MIELLLSIVLLIISLALIVKGADLLINGAADIARWLKISPLLVGLTIVAFGTSLPEFIVTIFSNWYGQGDIAVGNIIGSNIVNIGLVLGMSAVIVPLVIKSKTLMYELPFVTVASFLVLILGNNFFFFNQPVLSFDRVDGIILLSIFVLFLAYVFRSMRKEQKKVKTEFGKEYQHVRTLTKNSLFIISGLAALVIGGRLFVNAASTLALLAGLSQAFIGIIIAAVGTSLPELASSAVAAWKKQGDIAVGNIIGSNIFNILFVLGIAAVLKPVSPSTTLLSIDALVMVFFSLGLLLFASQDHKISRVEGGIFIIVYILFVLYQFFKI